MGSYATSYGFILNTFRHYDPTDPAQLVLVQLRLPRLLLALLAGASLAVSGYLLQTLVTNPLADPYLLGTASGASLGAIAAYVLVPSLTVAWACICRRWRRWRARLGPRCWWWRWAPGAGAFCRRRCCWRAWRWGRWRRPWAACSPSWPRPRAACAAWCSGRLAASSGPAGRCCRTRRRRWASACCVLAFLQKDLNLLLLGEERAAALGLPVAQRRWLLVLLAAGLTGGVVALCGPIGFVGLLVPHLTRGLLGTTGRYNLLVLRGAGRQLSAGLRLAGPPALPARRAARGPGHGPVRGTLLRIFAAEK